MTTGPCLYVFCEGQTEETFANLVLEPHFHARFGTAVYPLLLPNVQGSHSRRHKGGWNSYRMARQFMRGIMEQHHREGAWFTTLLDLHALPDDCPAIAAPQGTAARNKAIALEQAIREDLVTDALWRFMPHLQLHEFEALLLTDVGLLGKEFPERIKEIGRLKAELAGLAPEDVNDGIETHPSRRIIRHIPEYAGRKASAGPILASKIGLVRLRAACPHFAQWISELEQKLA